VGDRLPLQLIKPLTLVLVCPFPSHVCLRGREMAVRCIPEALEVATSHSEYQLILEISMTLANDHGG
jgi:hypothetical protein